MEIGLSELIEAALPLAAVLVPAFVIGFGAIRLVVHNGLTDMRKELHSIAERVVRIEGRLNPAE